MPARTRSWIVDGIAVFLLTAILIWPYFRQHYSPVWSSIESTFIADARMLNEPGTQGHWQPVWYAGTRSVYLYPPALRYGTALIARVLRIPTAHAYHIYVSLMYCIGSVAIYLLIRTGTRSRAWAWAGSAAVLFLCPIYLFMEEYLADSGHLVPHRLNVLVRYGEGPHISSLCLLPLALVAALIALQSRRMVWISLSAISCAVVVSNNFYGATALAILFPILVWSVFLVQPGWRVLLRGVAIPSLAYCLTAFWLVPSYLKVTRDNLRYVAEPGNTWSFVVFPFLIAGYLAVTWKWRGRDAYRVWVYSALFFMSVYILGHRWFGFQIAGQSVRLAPEFDVVIVLACIEVLRTIYSHSRGAALFLVYLAFLPGIPYLKNAWEIFPDDPNWQKSTEYKTAQWVAANYPSERAYVTGSIRFWFNAWHSTPQIDGGSQQGILHPLLPGALYCISHCTDAVWISDWLKAFAIDVAVVPEKSSREQYHDVLQPEFWRTHFTLIRDDGEGNAFYRFQRRSPGIVRIVSAAALRLKPIHVEDFILTLHPYVDAIEAAPPGGSDRSRLEVNRRNSDEFSRIDATTVDGEAVLVQETFDSAWHAYERTTQGERELKVVADPAGFMMIPLDAGRHTIRLAFETPAEIVAGRILAFGALLFVMYSIVELRKGREGEGGPNGRTGSPEALTA